MFSFEKLIVNLKVWGSEVWEQMQIYTLWNQDVEYDTLELNSPHWFVDKQTKSLRNHFYQFNWSTRYFDTKKIRLCGQKCKRKHWQSGVSEAFPAVYANWFSRKSLLITFFCHNLLLGGFYNYKTHFHFAYI